MVDRIDPSTGIVETSFSLPTADDLLFPLGALGIAYNPGTDQLYVSFCQAGCATLGNGLVKTFDSATVTPQGTLFRTSGFAVAGLAFDPVTNSIWAGAGDGINANQILHMTLDGEILSSFPRPGGFFADGLEFIGGGSTP